MTVVHPFGNKLQLLGNLKGKIELNERSRINEFSCNKYVGQTKHTIVTRFKEHMAHFKYRKGIMSRKSLVLHNMILIENYRIAMNNLRLIRNITNSIQLNAFESLGITKGKNSMNNEKVLSHAFIFSYVSMEIL